MSGFNVYTAEEILQGKFPDEPGEFFGYIDNSGYVAIKKYLTLQQYNNYKNDCLALFITKFHAKSFKDARNRLREILRLAHERFPKSQEQGED